MENHIKNSLIDIVGRDNFTDALIDRISYASDASDHRSRPDAAAWPTTAEQISKILALANTHRFPVTPRGGGTSLAGTAVPARGGLVIDLCRMNRILDIRIPDRLAIVEPGVIYADFNKALEPYGFFFPPDPASGKVCTLGGNVATNAGGIRGAKYGVTRDYVLGLEVVLPDGRIARTGSACMKSVSGYDLTRLFVGSEGTLGVVTQITFKISPMPLAFKTCLASFPELGNAGRAVTDIMHSGILPSVLEVMDAYTIRILREHGKIDFPDTQAILLVETDGYTEAEASFQMDKIVRIFEKNRAFGIQTAATSKEAEQLWRARKATGSIAALLRPNNLSEDVAVPLSMVPAFLVGASEILCKYELPFVIFGHAGDGNLHPKVMFDGSDPEETRRVHLAIGELFKLTCDLGGTLTGEHGIGLAKAPYLELEHDPVSLDVMRSLKKLFDPNDILNPGKMHF